MNIVQIIIKLVKYAGGKGRKVFDLPEAVWVGCLCLVFCWDFFFNDNLKHLAILS